MNVATNIVDTSKKIVVYDENILISEGKVEKKETKSRAPSKVLRNAAIAYYTVGGIIKCDVSGFSYEEVYGNLGKEYIEIHHEKPICEYGSDGNAQFVSEAIKNIKSLCANCHRMIHRNPLKLLIIKKLKGAVALSN